jgi:membrane-associated phospholipid phosphatase
MSAPVSPRGTGRLDAKRPDEGRLRRVVAQFGPTEWVLLIAFVVLTAAVATGFGVQSFDDWAVRTLPWAEAPGGPHSLARASYLLVLLAQPEVSVTVTLVVAGVWSWSRGDLDPLRRIAPPVLAGGFVVLALKVLVRRPGPPLSDPVTIAGYFPSGHTATALLCAGVLASAVAERRPRRRAPLLAVAGAWTLAMAAALLYHRFHWVSDVLGSVLLGLLVLRLSRARSLPPDPTHLQQTEVRSLRPAHPSSDGAS